MMSRFALDNLNEAKKRLIFATVIGLWIYCFLVIIGPFDSQPLELHWRAQLMLGYGLLSALSCWFSDLILDRLFSSSITTNWWKRQLVFALVFNLINFWPVFGYYGSDIVQGEWKLERFILEVYLPMAFVLLPFILAGRYVLLGKRENTTDPTIVLRGAYKMDVLRLQPYDLLYLKTAGNYVEVYFSEAGLTKKRLLRTTLKELMATHPFLLQTHRSLVINPSRVTEWSGRRAIRIAGDDIPVSTTYLSAVERVLLTRPHDQPVRH